MDWRNTTERYGALSIGMHWLMLLVLVAVYACIELRELYPEHSAAREALETLHYSLGLTVLALVALRLAIRWSSPGPRPAAGTPAWQRRAAAAVHVALYALMIGMPLLGWLALSAGGEPIRFFGLALPPLLAPDEALAHDLEEVHEAFGTAGYFLVGLHALAALVHHYAMRDDTLVRMLPQRR